MKVICGNNEYDLNVIVDEYIDMIYRLAMVRTDNKENAEEVVQETFLRLVSYVKKGKTFTDDEHLKAWIIRVAINRGKSLIASAWNRRTEALDTAVDVAGEEPKYEYAYEYVMKLPENQRIAINLFYYEQFTTEQIANYMDTKTATVRSYLHRGREKLKEMMEADGYVG